MGAYEFACTQTKLKIWPRTINRNSSSNRLFARLYLPQGLTKDDFDCDTPLVLYPGGIEAAWQRAFRHCKNGVPRVSVLALFDRSALLEAVPEDGRVELQVVGQLTTGRRFYGCCTVRIVTRPSSCPQR